MFLNFDATTVIFLEKLISHRKAQGQSVKKIMQELFIDHGLKVSEGLVRKIYIRLLNKTKHHQKQFCDPSFLKSILNDETEDNLNVKPVETALLYVSKYQGKTLLLTPKPTDFLFPKIDKWRLVNTVICPENNFWKNYEIKVWLET